MTLLAVRSTILLEDPVAYDMPLVVERSLLIRWHLQDLPDDMERSRNEAIEALQGTRNPFIDDPALAGLVGP